MNDNTTPTQNTLRTEQQTQKPYYLGLDMGTSSLGFAVTDRYYNVIRKRGRHLWGIRLFEEAKRPPQRGSFALLDVAVNVKRNAFVFFRKFLRCSRREGPRFFTALR